MHSLKEQVQCIRFVRILNSKYPKSLTRSENFHRKNRKQCKKLGIKKALKLGELRRAGKT